MQNIRSTHRPGNQHAYVGTWRSTVKLECPSRSSKKVGHACMQAGRTIMRMHGQQEYENHATWPHGHRDAPGYTKCQIPGCCTVAVGFFGILPVYD